MLDFVLFLWGLAVDISDALIKFPWWLKIGLKGFTYLLRKLLEYLLKKKKQAREAAALNDEEQDCDDEVQTLEEDFFDTEELDFDEEERVPKDG